MKTFFLAAATLFFFGGFAQKKFTPTIRQGSTLHYILKDGNGVSNILIRFDSISADYIKMGWSMESVGKGGWILKKKSIESAKGGYWTDLESNTQVELAENQSVVLLSKAQWQGIQTGKKLELDGQVFTPNAGKEQQPYKLNNKEVDYILLQSENGNTRIWVLNKATLPVILKIEGNPVGVDAELTSVEP